MAFIQPKPGQHWPAGVSPRTTYVLSRQVERIKDRFAFKAATVVRERLRLTARARAVKDYRLAHRDRDEGTALPGAAVFVKFRWREQVCGGNNLNRLFRAQRQVRHAV